MRSFIIVISLLLTCSHVSAAERIYTSYYHAYRAAESSRRYLLVTIGYDAFYMPSNDRHVLCRLPVGDRVASHESVRDMGGSGVFIVDLANAAHYRQVVSILPAKHCSFENIAALLALQSGTLTQRTLVWAVRMHPDKPQSTNGAPGTELMAHAERHSQAQADANRMYHNLPTDIATSEIVAYTWDRNRNIVDAAVDLVGYSETGVDFDSPGH